MMKTMVTYRFLLKTTLLVLITLALAPWYFLLLLLFFRWRYRVGPKLVQFYSRACLRVLRVRIDQIKNSGTTEKLRKGALLLANHVSFLDIFVLSAEFGTVFLSKSEIKYYPIIGQIAWLMGVIFLNRDASHERLRVLRTIAGRCTEQIIAVFPQGTTGSIADRLPFSRGIFKVTELNPEIALLPVTLFYKEDTAIAWKKPASLRDNLLKVCGQDTIHIRIFIHKPVTIADYRGRTASQVCRSVEKTVLEPLQKEYDID